MVFIMKGFVFLAQSEHTETSQEKVLNHSTCL